MILIGYIRHAWFGRLDEGRWKCNCNRGVVRHICATGHFSRRHPKEQGTGLSTSCLQKQFHKRSAPRSSSGGFTLWMSNGGRLWFYSRNLLIYDTWGQLSCASLSFIVMVSFLMVNVPSIKCLYPPASVVITWFFKTFLGGKVKGDF